MGSDLFDQLVFVRQATLKTMEGVSEELADRIPDGFRNSIRWQFGHIYTVLERLAFKAVRLELNLPQGYKDMFEYGTLPPAASGVVAVPSLSELRDLLSGQPKRIRDALAGRLEEEVEPYTTSTGITLATPRQFLQMNLYHEGMHQSMIKAYKTILNRI